MADTTKSVRPEGTGPTLLLLHGNPTWSFLFRDVIGALSADFRCVALDYPGFGLSTPGPGYRYLPEEHADVVTGFLDALGLEEVILVGQGRILASRNFFTELEAGLTSLAHLPTLIVWGDADIAFRPQERERLEATFTDHRTVIVEGAGTYVESDAPEEFAAAVRDWVTT